MANCTSARNVEGGKISPVTSREVENTLSLRLRVRFHAYALFAEPIYYDAQRDTSWRVITLCACDTKMPTTLTKSRSLDTGSDRTSLQAKIFTLLLLGFQNLTNIHLT